MTLFQIVRDRLSEDGGTENNNDLLLCELYDSEGKFILSFYVDLL